jgi:DNA-binding CsgD family transcriptional regulator
MSLHFSGGRKLQRNEEMHKLRADGMSYQLIGDMYKISRQRVHQVVTRLDESEV